MTATKRRRVLTLATLFPNPVRPNHGVFVWRQTQALARHGAFDPVVINPIGLPPWPLREHRRYHALSRLDPFEQTDGVAIHRPHYPIVPLVGAALQPQAIARAVLPLVRRLHAEAPFDLIAAEFLHPDGGAARRIAAALDLPYSLKARGADVHYWAQRRDTAPAILEAAGGAAGLLAVSEALKGDLAAIGIDPARITVHYTGCDQARFRPQDGSPIRQRLNIGGPMLVSVGALIERKRQDLAIAALPHLPEASLVLIGEGPEEPAYRALAERLGVAERIRFLGAIAHDALPGYLAAADAMVLVSRSEGLANAWVEALACGTPIVIGDAGGARELLADPAAGRIVAADAEAIADAVKALLAASAPAEAVRATVADFTWSRNAAALADYYRALLG